jgi:hypothetical protein
MRGSLRSRGREGERMTVLLNFSTTNFLADLPTEDAVGDERPEGGGDDPDEEQGEQ